MKKIITDESNTTVHITCLSENEQRPIFIKRDGKLVGMVIKDNVNCWSLFLGNKADPSGWKPKFGWNPKLKDCIEDGIKRGYEFYLAND